MPRRPLRLCAAPGCPRLVEQGRCPAHARAQERAVDQRRGSAASRGYGHRWRVYRLWYLARHPLCVECGEAATDVDHVRAVSGPDDAAFWDEDNHQALCHACHSRKTDAEDGGFGRGRPARE